MTKTDVVAGVSWVRGIWLACVVASVLGWTSPSAAAPNLAGTWMLWEGTTMEVVDIEQSDDSVSFTLAGIPLSGTVSEEGRLRMMGVNIPADTLTLDGDVSDDGALLSASVLRVTSPPLALHGSSLFGMRCACVDGNANDGDGCDAVCQVEPCWTCSPAPSECSPASDGAPCEAGACIGGSVCTSGVCTGGTAITPCVNLSGGWAVDAEMTSDFTTERSYAHSHRTVQQHGNRIIVDGRSFGTINSATGVASWTELGGFFGFGLCGDDIQAVRLPYSAWVASDSLSLTTRGTHALFVSRCPLAGDVTEIGIRNASTCGSDGTACSSDACHTGQTCLDDVCQGGSLVQCSDGAHCEAARGCVSEPPGLGCPGDCNHDGKVKVDELMTGVNIALERLLAEACLVFDRNFDSRLNIDELVSSVRAALSDCR